MMDLRDLRHRIGMDDVVGDADPTLGALVGGAIGEIDPWIRVDDCVFLAEITHYLRIGSFKALPYRLLERSEPTDLLALPKQLNESADTDLAEHPLGY